MAIELTREFLQSCIDYWRKQYRDLNAIAHFAMYRDGEVPYYMRNELDLIKFRIQEARNHPLMNRYMYDSTAPQHIPPNARIVAYYPHAWGTDISSHPNALVVRIDNRGDHADDCHILDVETGAASNAIAAEWAASWHKLHPAGLDCVNGWIRKPVLYTSSSNLATLRGIVGSTDVDYWGAQWDGNVTPIPGCFAKQYADPSMTGGDYDASMVFDDTWGVSPKTPPSPPVKPPAPTPGTLAALLVWGVGPDVCNWREVHSQDGGKTWG